MGGGGNSLALETIHFIAQKVWGLFPLYIIGFVLSFVANQYVSHPSLEQFIKNLFRSALAFFRVGTTVGLIVDEPLGAAWYISAMLLSMMIIYPLVRYRRTIYTYIVAPLICMFIYGYLQFNYGCAATLDWNGICTNGLLRGIAGISLGCVAYEFSEKIRSKNWTMPAKKWMTGLEIGGYLLAIIHMKYLWIWGSNDFVIVMILALSVAISGSCKSYSGKSVKGRSKIWAELGLALYMGHMPVRTLVLHSERFVSFESKLIIYLVSSLVLSFILRWLGIWLKRFLDSLCGRVRDKCIAGS